MKYPRFVSATTCWKRHFMLLLSLLCIAIGVTVGTIMHVFKAPDVAILYVGLFGELFMRALNFSVIPLLACNIIAVSAKLKPSTQGAVALLSLAFCVSMNLTGSFFGLISTVLINPGNRFGKISASPTSYADEANKLSMTDVFPDFMRNLVPDNIMKTLLYSTVTTYTEIQRNQSDAQNSTGMIYQRDVGTSGGPNIPGILVSSLVIGLVAGSCSDKTQPLIALAEAITEVMTVLIEKIIKLLPFAMISLIASAVGRTVGLEKSLIALGMFVVTSIVYLSAMALVVLPLFYLVLVRRNLFKVYAAVATPAITAFSVTSSLIALPDFFKSCERLGVDARVVRTIAPFLTSFNANGSAAFIASAVCFTAQAVGHPLNVGQLIGIGFLAGVNVMALPAVPSASLITVFLIIRVFQIPESAISLLFVSEFIVDRMRTVVNVLSHGTCVMFVYIKDSERQLQRVESVKIEYIDEVSAFGNNVIPVEKIVEEGVASDEMDRTNQHQQGDN